MSNKNILDVISVVMSMILFALAPTSYTAFALDQLSDEFLKVAFELPYSRHKESEADAVGLMLAARVFIYLRLFTQV